MLTDRETIRRIESLARVHSNPASNPGAHRLAAKILDIIRRPSKVKP